LIPFLIIQELIEKMNMKTAVKYREEAALLREDVIKTLLALREEVKDLYMKQTGSEEFPDGNIQLTQGFIHSYIDDQSNEVISALSVDGELCLLDTGYDTRNIEFRDISTYGLIYIVEELEDMIENPETIDIF
jgi:hypothetical protein